MKMKFILPLTLVAVVAISCKNDKTTEENTNTVENTTTENTTTDNTGNSQNMNTTANTSGEVQLNPAHGMPGHRCDIPVGQPLNSQPNNVKIETNTSENQQSIFINNTSNSNNSGSAKLNPAHGQPGHRCDIPVGQPLPEN